MRTPCGPVEITPLAGATPSAFALGTAGIGREPVLAVHGITANSRAWLAVARALEDRAQLVAVDLRGRGASAALPGPYGIDAHVSDLVALLDRLGVERAVLAGHSLGAYIVAALAAAHPERVRSLVLVDGGLPIPGGVDVDPQAFLEAFLGPALARLRMTFPSPDAYRAWWREHPALAGAVGAEGGVEPGDLDAYADHDLTGSEQELRPTVREEAVRADAADLLGAGRRTWSVHAPAVLLCAPRGLLDDPNPMQPLALVQAWAAEDPDRRSARLVEEVNHYTITLGARGASAVADAIAAAAAARSPAPRST